MWNQWRKIRRYSVTCDKALEGYSVAVLDANRGKKQTNKKQKPVGFPSLKNKLKKKVSASIICHISSTQCYY